jgi:hypothetical protein
MRALPLVVLTASLLTFSVSAQITSVKEYPPQFNKSRQIWEEVVENQSSRSIVAMHTTFDCIRSTPTGDRKAGVSGGFDVLSIPTYLEIHEAIPSGDATTMPAGDPSRCSGGVDAVIFADGHSEGNPRWVNEDQQTWVGVHQGIIESLPLLAKVANQEADLAEVEDLLRDRKVSIPEFPLDINRTFDRKKIGERLVYTNLESLLHSMRGWKAASDSTPHSQLRSEEVAEVQATGIPRKQEPKVATFLVSKLQEWKTAVENGLGSSAAK